MTKKYESHDNGTRLLLEETPDGPAISLDLMDGGESTAGTQIYLSPERIAGMVKWLAALSEIREPQVVGRVWNDQGQGTAQLNSVGRALPDDTPLYSAPVSAIRQNPAQSVPEGMWYFTFYCENYDAVQRVRVAANAPREFTCGVTGIDKARKP